MYLTRHLASILRQDSDKLLQLINEQLFLIVRDSLNYLSDAKADLEIILKFAARMWGDNNIFNLYKKFSERWDSCHGFD